jgi:hypothetical protein
MVGRPTAKDSLWPLGDQLLKWKTRQMCQKCHFWNAQCWSGSIAGLSQLLSGSRSVSHREQTAHTQHLKNWRLCAPVTSLTASMYFGFIKCQPLRKTTSLFDRTHPVEIRRSTAPPVPVLRRASSPANPPPPPPLHLRHSTCRPRVR